MLHSANLITHSLQEFRDLNHYLRRAWSGFWRFSQFYGDYQALPPSERRRFVIDQQKQQNRS